MQGASFKLLSWPVGMTQQESAAGAHGLPQLCAGSEDRITRCMAVAGNAALIMHIND